MSGARFIYDCRGPRFRDLVSRKQRIEIPRPTPTGSQHDFDEAWKNVLIFGAGFFLCFLLLGVWR